MKSFLAIISIIGFISVAVFGFLAMGNMNDMAHNGCLAALAQNGICPFASTAPFTAAFSHLDILKSFSSALLTGAVSILSLIAAAFVLAAGGMNTLLTRSNNAFLYSSELFKDKNYSLVKQFNWLAGHLNSPSLALGA